MDDRTAIFGIHAEYEQREADRLRIQKVLGPTVKVEPKVKLTFEERIKPKPTFFQRLTGKLR